MIQSVVVVNGLISFRRRASKSNLGDASWILHQLPHCYPGCRISIFNYLTRNQQSEAVFTRQGTRTKSVQLLDSLVSLRRCDTV